MNPREAANRYVAGINTQDAEMASSVFASDGWMLPPPPGGGAYQGRDVIKAYFEKLFSTLPSMKVEAEYITEGNRCVARLTTNHELRGTVDIIDVFTLNEAGEVTEMRAYKHSPFGVPDKPTP